MRSRVLFAVLIPIAVLAAGHGQQATIIDTGSTNFTGITLIVNAGGSTKVQPEGAESHTVNLDPKLSEKLFEDLDATGRLSELPRAHCMKSVSFGSSRYVEFNGERSPDLNCPAPAGSKLSALQKDVREIMQAAHAERGTNRARVAGQIYK